MFALDKVNEGMRPLKETVDVLVVVVVVVVRGPVIGSKNLY